MTSPNAALSILAAYEGTAESQAAIRAARRLALATSAAWTVIHVINPLTDLGGISASSTEEAVRIKTSERNAEISQLIGDQSANATILVEPITRGEDVAAH